MYDAYKLGTMSRSSGVQTFRSERLKRERQKAGLSAEQVAVLAGISPETVRRAESGAGRYPSARVVRQLAEALGTTVEHLAPSGDSPRTLRHIRQQLGRTQREIAQLVGKSVQMVSRVERGVYRASQPELWAKAYAVSRKRWLSAWQAGRDERGRAIKDRGGT
ncbi:hypothetical protein GCM10009801_81890 [Streptomyces albiaxialis]|uniref:HTH cro/C1-type domain-containing protein n=1 Tax=Streptomyces albiaxialis TaxID=329523 RepID=A0ABP5IS40_9ACTN